MKKEIEYLGGKDLCRSKKLILREDHLRLPDGKEIKRDLVIHPGAVVFIPINANRELVLLSQYRYPIKKTIIEFPAGTLESNEEPLVCAQREIKEEIGFGANSWRPIGEIYPVPGWANEILYAFIASDLYPEKLTGDADEIIDTITLTAQQVEEAIADGRINDAKTIAIFARARYLGLV